MRAQIKGGVFGRRPCRLYSRRPPLSSALPAHHLPLLPGCRHETRQQSRRLPRRGRRPIVSAVTSSRTSSLQHDGRCR